MRQFYLYIIGVITIFISLCFGSPRLEKVTTSFISYDQLHTSDGTQYHTPIHQESLQPTNTASFLPLDLRSIDDFSLNKLLLVTDIDGNLHGVNRNSGTLLWTLPMDEPLVRISSNNTLNNAQSNILWFVEPYQDGSLFYFTPKFGMNKLPTSIKDLVLESPFSLSGDDKIYTGTRKTSLYNINIHSGKIKSSFGNSENCPVPNTHIKVHPHMRDNEDTILIGKTTYELSIYSKVHTNIVWNVTYSQWGPNNIDNDLIMQNKQSSDKLYFTPFHDKSLLAINKELGTPMWISKLPSLAVNVFDVFHNSKNSEYVLLPHPLKVLNDLQIQIDAETHTSNNDLVFVNKTSDGKEWFAMSFNNYPTLIKNAPVSKYQLDLYKLQNGIPVDIEYLRTFRLLTDLPSSVEELVSGIHKTYELTGETMYQPVPKFEFSKTPMNLIGDGSEVPPQELYQNHSPDSHDQSQNLMEGIRFPERSSPNVGSELILLTSSVNNKVSNPNNVPPPLSPGEPSDIDEEYQTSSRTGKVVGFFTRTVFRRVIEDVLILLLIGVLVVTFGKKFYFKLEFNSSKQDAINQELVGHIPDTKSSLLTKELPELPKETKPVKRVTILEPNDNLEKDPAESDVTNSEPFEMVEVTAQIPNATDLNNADSSEADISQIDSKGEETNDEDSTKKKRKRGSRGGKRGGRKINKNKPAQSNEIGDVEEPEEDDDDDETEEIISTKSLIKATTAKVKIPIKKLQIENNLVISDKILGYGSHGTVVYQGTFENRPVAVKRMLLDFFDIANHEVRLLQESDDHPNVIRYFCSQSSESEKFLYIALELCLCSLEDIVEKPKKTLRLSIPHMNEVLYQLVSGLHYLHSLKIVHRDLKPQNILVATAKKNKHATTSKDDAKFSENDVRLLISDFGLCKKLESDQSSFRATTQNAASGTSGWRAPELLLNHDLLEISPDTISSIGSNSRHSINESSQSSNLSPTQGKRLTKAIDIFPLGCVFFYILTGGFHPFGERYLREGNIIKGDYDLSLLLQKCPNDKYESTHLISSMIHANPSLRPGTSKILVHPLFWSPKKRLEFLLKVSDRFEVEKRDPPSDLLMQLETHGYAVHKGNWQAKFDDEFMQSLGKYRKYSPDKLMDLLRSIRNKYHHFGDMPQSLQTQMSPLPDGFYKFFNDRFPNLLMEVYFLISGDLSKEHIFKDFF